MIQKQADGAGFLNNMLIFSDFHHSSLYTSLQMLFEVRLNHQLFRPIGEEWFNKGYWKLAEPYKNNPDTIMQYLGIRDHYKPMDGTKPLNDIKEYNEYYLIKSFPYDHKALTLKQFKDMKFDLIIASYQPHIEPYLKLIQTYQPQAKFCHQQGNEWVVDFNKVKNLLASVLPYNIPNDVNACWYSQEFDLDIFKPEYSEKKIIRSFVNTLATQSLFHRDWIDFLELEKYLPEYKFESYGAGCREGVINEQKELAKLMRESKYALHLKNQGDGWGHVIFNFFSCGKPVIYRASQYKNRLASKLLIHRETGIDLDQVGITGAVNIIRNQSLSEYSKMCTNITSLFKKYVDFDKEQKDIEVFLSKLK